MESKAEIPISLWQELLAGKRGIRRYIGPKRIIALTVLALVLAGTWYLRREGWLHPAILLPWLDHYPLASALSFILLYALAVVSPLPTLPFNLAAGFFWGGWLGGGIATIGSSLGAVASFYLSRLLLGQLLARRFDHRLVRRLQAEFAANGWQFIAFVRIVPVFPTGPLNYLLGLTTVGGWVYTWTTLLFTLPPALVFAAIGQQLGGFILEGEVADRVTTGLTLLAALVILLLLRYAAKLYRQSRDELVE